MTSVAAVISDPGDSDRMRWLARLVAACELVLADPADSSDRKLRQGVKELLGRVKAEMEGER